MHPATHFLLKNLHAPQGPAFPPPPALPPLLLPPPPPQPPLGFVVAFISRRREGFSFLGEILIDLLALFDLLDLVFMSV